MEKSKWVLLIPVFGVFLLFVVLMAVGQAAFSSANSGEGSGGGAQGMVCGEVRDGGVAGYRGDQLQVAAKAVATAKELHVDQQGMVIEVATMMVESNMRELDGGDRDSVGPFQQRDAWGSHQERKDAASAAKLFFKGGKGGQPGLLSFDYQSMEPGDAAQKVQGSAFPGRYAGKIDAARQVVGAVIGVSCQSAGGGAGGGSAMAQKAIQRAMSVQGTPYAWGGGNASGPTQGTGPDAGVRGFDCSGLMVFAYAGAGVQLPHQTQAMWNKLQPAVKDRKQVQPGDMLEFSSDGSPGGIHHIGLYLGNGAMVQAPQSGDVVKVTKNVWENPYYGKQFIGALRPGK